VQARRIQRILHVRHWPSAHTTATRTTGAHAKEAHSGTAKAHTQATKAHTHTTKAHTQATNANPRTKNANPCATRANPWGFVCVPTFTNSTQRKNLQYFNHRQHDQKEVHKNV
jgi:hypothetical protein